MQETDLNLLVTLHALLTEEHVTRAAARLHLSIPATSRALARCRRTFGDPLLVRRGRGVVATPRAVELLARLDPLVRQIGELLERPGPFDPASLRRSFSIRAGDAVVAAIGATLADGLHRAAPHVELRFEPEAADDLDALRTRDTALAIGSYGDIDRELRSEHVAREWLVGVVRAGHPLAGRRVGLRAFAGLGHVVTARRGQVRGPVDELLAERGLQRDVVAVVGSFTAALALCVGSNLTALVPRRLALLLAGPGTIVTYTPPVPLPAVDVVQVWHDRHTVDPAHVWLRGEVRRAAAALDC